MTRAGLGDRLMKKTLTGMIAYHMDNPEDAHSFESMQDVNCWTYESNYPVEEIMTIPYSFSGEDRLKELNKLLNDVRTGEID